MTTDRAGPPASEPRGNRTRAELEAENADLKARVQDVRNEARKAREDAIKLEHYAGELQAANDRLLNMLHGLLARAHRDGGQRTAAIGDEAAADEADALIATAYADRDSLRTDLDLALANAARWQAAATAALTARGQG